MPHLSGVFEQFPDLDKITPLSLLSWLKIKIEKHSLINILGNRILYPQTAAMNNSELEIDLAILKEALKQRPALVYEAQTNKLFIPEEFCSRFPTLQNLTRSIVEAINPKGVIQIYRKNKNKPKLIGTLISPVDVLKLTKDKEQVKIVIGNIEGTLKRNSMSISPLTASQTKVKIEDEIYTVFGGELGLVIDLRTKG